MLSASHQWPRRTNQKKSLIYKLPNPKTTFHNLQHIKTPNHLAAHTKSVYGFQFCSILLLVSQYLINRHRNPWSDLAWHWCQILLFQLVTGFIYRPHQILRMFSVLSKANQVLALPAYTHEACPHNKLLGTISIVIHTSMLYSGKKCWPSWEVWKKTSTWIS